MVLSNGNVLAYKVSNAIATEINITPRNVGEVVLPTMVMDSSDKVMLANVFEDGAIYSAPVIVDAIIGHRV